MIACEIFNGAAIQQFIVFVFWLTGDLLEESQTEASKLRKRVEELVRDNEALKSSTSSFASNVCMGAPVQTDTQSKSDKRL